MEKNSPLLKTTKKSIRFFKEMTPNHHVGAKKSQMTSKYELSDPGPRCKTYTMFYTKQ